MKKKNKENKNLKNGCPHLNVDPTDLESIREFLEQYNFLRTTDLAILADKSPSTIKRWKRRVGIRSSSPFKNPYKAPPSKEVKYEIVPPEVWNNKEWFIQKYEVEKIGTPTIAKMIDRDISTVTRHLKKFGIKKRSKKEANKSKNKYCTEEWLYEHYSTRDEYLEWCERNNKVPKKDGGKGWPASRCAGIAGISDYTLCDWLARFKMKIRTRRDVEKLKFQNKKNNNEIIIQGSSWSTGSEKE